MIVYRWQAPVFPDQVQVIQIFRREGLKPELELYSEGSEVIAHRHPFDEVRMLVNGSLQIDVGGTQLLLRRGDKIIIPSNTVHSKKVMGKDDCLSVCSFKSF